MADKNDREDFLKQPNVAVLATVDGRGRPHAAPVWYLYDDGEFIISTNRGSQKHKNLMANPEVTLVVDRRELPYLALMVRGRVELGPRLSDADRLRLAVRYLGEELGRAYAARTQVFEENVSVRLRPRKVIEFDPTAGS